jgi:hypothetical protein
MLNLDATQQERYDTKLSLNASPCLSYYPLSYLILTQSERQLPLAGGKNAFLAKKSLT